MNKSDQEKIESRIRSMEEAPYCPTDERIEEIKKHAFDEYEQYIRVKENSIKKKVKRGKILRRTVAAFALVVFFMICSFVYSVFAPVTIASANNFVRRASIWINNQLHLGITFSSPVDDANKVEHINEKIMYQMDELRKEVGFPIIYIPESEDLRITGIDLVTPAPGQQEVSIWYITGLNESIAINNELIYESNSINLDTTSLKPIETSIGTVYIWTDGAYSYATCFMEQSYVSITTTLSNKELEQFLYKLTYLN